MDTLKIVKDEIQTWFMFPAGSDSRAPGYLSVCSPCRPKLSPHPYQSFSGTWMFENPAQSQNWSHHCFHWSTCPAPGVDLLQTVPRGQVSAYTASLNRCLRNFGVLILYLCLLNLRQARTSPAAKKQADLPEEYHSQFSSFCFHFSHLWGVWQLM